jgi:hypothetical protein
VRANVLEAARKSAAERRAAAAPVVRPRERETVGLVERLLAWLKRPWFVPALVGAAAIAVFAIGRDTIMAPNVRQAFNVRDHADEAAPVAAPAVVEEAKGQAAPAAAPAEPEADKTVSRARSQLERAAPKVARKPTAGVREREGAEGARAEEKPSRARAEAKQDLDDALGAESGVERRAGPRQGVVGSGAAADGRYAAPPAGWARGGAGAAAQANAGAATPRPAAAPAPAKKAAAPATAPVAQAPARVSAPAPEAAAAPAPQPTAAASEPAPSAPRPLAKSRKAEAPASADRADDAESSRSATRGAPRDWDGGDHLRGLTNEALLVRADHAFEAGEWLEARAAYVELFRRDPRNAAAARWKARVAECDRVLRAR